MGDFFHGWRRKIGVVTLVMACLFMAAWVRSQFVVDQATINISPLWHVPQSYNVITSLDGCVSWTHIYGTQLNERMFKQRSSWRTHEKTAGGIMPNRLVPMHLVKRELRWPSAGFYIGTGKEEILPGQLLDIVGVKLPYWSIVIPLTVLSAYLLLSKPRAAKLPENQPPTI